MVIYCTINIKIISFQVITGKYIKDQIIYNYLYLIFIYNYCIYNKCNNSLSFQAFYASINTTKDMILFEKIDKNCRQTERHIGRHEGWDGRPGSDGVGPTLESKPALTNRKITVS